MTWKVRTWTRHTGESYSNDSEADAATAAAQENGTVQQKRESMDKETFFNEPDFSGWYSQSQLNEYFQVKFDDDGWYNLSNGDTVLIIERHNKYRVNVWVKDDPREAMEKILDLPEFG